VGACERALRDGSEFALRVGTRNQFARGVMRVGGPWEGGRGSQ
jgi:hypothetical protein